MRDVRGAAHRAGPLVWGIGLLLAVEAVLIVANVWRMPGLWRLGHEGSFPTFLHTGVLFAAAAVYWAVHRAGRRSGTVRRPFFWLAGGVGLVYLGLDEALQFHERGSRLVFEAIGIQDRIARYELTPALWEALFAPLFAAIAVFVLGALVQERRRAPLALRLGLVAFGIWALALATEFVETTYFIDEEFWFGAAIWLEETSEMVGSTVLLIAALVATLSLGVELPGTRRAMSRERASPSATLTTGSGRDPG